MRLRRSVVAEPGLRRVRRGRGFSYQDTDGRAVTDPATLARIEDLVIPPAWKNVWICPHPNGHIQAVGTDVAGRRQYLYHQRWSEERSEEKFDRREVGVLALTEADPTTPGIHGLVGAGAGANDLYGAQVVGHAVQYRPRQRRGPRGV